MRYYLSRLEPCTARIIQFCKTSLMLNLCLTILAGCSSFNTKKVESLSLPAYKLADSLKYQDIEWPQNWDIKKIDEDPFIYQIRVAEEDEFFLPAYATALKECKLKKSADSASTTRQLMVGLKNIKILREENFLYADKRVFFKHFAAELDEHSLHLLSFSARENDCVFDTVIWSNDYSPGSVINSLGSADKNNLQKIYYAFSRTEK